MFHEENYYAAVRSYPSRFLRGCHFSLTLLMPTRLPPSFLDDFLLLPFNLFSAFLFISSGRFQRETSKRFSTKDGSNDDDPKRLKRPQMKRAPVLFSSFDIHTPSSPSVIRGCSSQKGKKKRKIETAAKEKNKHSRIARWIRVIKGGRLITKDLLSSRTTNGKLVYAPPMLKKRKRILDSWTGRITKVYRSFVCV